MIYHRVTPNQIVVTSSNVSFSQILWSGLWAVYPAADLYTVTDLASRFRQQSRPPGVALCSQLLPDLNNTSVA